MSFVPALPPMTAADAKPQRRNMLPVLGTGQWTQAAQQANWVLGHGSTLVTSGPSQQDLSSLFVPEFRFKCMPRPQNTYRLWTVSLAADENGGGCILRSLDGATQYARVDIPPSSADVKAHTGWIVAFPTSNADDAVDGSGHSEFGFEIVVDAGVGAIWVTSIGCYEMPLVYVKPDEIAVDNATFPDEESCSSGKPIYDDAGTPPAVGAAACAWAASAAEVNAKRSAMAAWQIWETASITTSTFVDAYGGRAPLLARRRYSTDGAGNRSIRVWVYAFGTGQVRLTMTNGSTATLTYATPAAFQWQTATISVDSENLANLGTDGGLRSGTRDELRVEIRCTDAVLLAVRTICAGEID